MGDHPGSMSSHCLHLCENQPANLAGAHDGAKLLSARGWFILLAAYFALHAMLRIIVSPCVELDEAEQIVFSQAFAWSYGNSLPLYTWLQRLAFMVFGESVLGLTVLKNALLFSLVALSYSTARAISRSHRVGMVASCCVLLTPQISWESQRDLTHSVLASVVVLGWVGCFEKAHRTGQWRWYAVLGLVTAAGALSKFNFHLFAVGMIMAAFTIPSFGPSLMNRRAATAAAILLAIVVVWWIGYQGEGAHLHRATARLRLDANTGWLQSGAVGLWNVVSAVLGSIAIPAMILAALTKAKPFCGISREVEDWLRFFGRGWVIMGGAMIVAIPVFHVNGFHQRWLQPLLMGFPMFAALAWSARIDRRVAQRMACFGVAVMLAVAIVLPSRTLFGWGKDEPYLRPYPALSRALRHKLPENTFLVADTSLLAGNLRLGMKNIVVVTPEVAHLASGLKHCVAVWDATKSSNPPQRLLDWASTQNLAKTAWHYEKVAAPYRRDLAKQRVVAFVQLW